MKTPEAPDYSEHVEPVLYDADIEKSVIGSIFIDNACIKQLDMQPDDFFILRNRYIFIAMTELDREGNPIDYQTVQSKIIQQGHADDIDMSYIVGLLSEMFTSVNVETYADILKDLSARRKTVQIANELARSAYNREVTITQTISDITQRLPAITKTRTDAKHISHYVSRHYDLMESRINEPEKFLPMKTGMRDFDFALGGGIRQGELIMLMGKPGLGKTKWLAQLGHNLGKANHPGCIIEMELDEYEMMDREFSRETRIPVERMEKASDMTPEDWGVYNKAVEQMASENLPVYMDFGTHWNTTTLHAQLTKLKAEHGIKWFTLDYMKFLTDTYRGEEFIRLGIISGRMRRICKDLHLAGVVVNSMNKMGVAAEVPDLEHMSGDAQGGFDVDKAIFMTDHIPGPGEVKTENVTSFIFGKSRRQIHSRIFHMVNMKGYPAFCDIERKTP